MGLSGEDHLFLHGVSKRDNISESMMNLFHEGEIEEIPEEVDEKTESKDKENANQFTLDSFS